MTNSIVNDLNNQIQINEPDIQMAKDFLLAIHSGCKPDDVIALMPNFESKPVNAYVTYSDLKKNFEDYAKKLCESNFKQVTTTANPLKREINRFWNALANHTKEQVTRWTSFVLDFDRAKDTTKKAKEYPATKEELAEISKAREDVSDFLQGNGFCSPIKASSGNGYYLIYLLDLELKERKKTAIEAIYNTISDVISKHKNVNIDKAFFDKIGQNLPIAGTVNRKFPDGQRLRELEDCPELDQIPAIRQANSEAMIGFLAAMDLKGSTDLPIFQKKESNVPKYIERSEAQAVWEQTTSWEDVLEGSGATKVKEYNGYTQWRRGGKESGGLSFVTGSNKGGNDRLYCYSTNAIFPSGTGLTKYWVYLTAKGWAKWNGYKPSIVNKDAKEQWFQNEVMRRRINYSFNDPSEVTNLELIESEEPEAKVYEIDEDNPEADGSLANFTLPGIIEDWAKDIEKTAPYHAMTASRMTAYNQFSFMVGRSRKFTLKHGDKAGTLPLNVYSCIVSDSGGGKETSKKYTSNLFYNVELNRPFQNKVGKPDFSIAGSSGTSASTNEGSTLACLEHGRLNLIMDEGEKLLFKSDKESPQTENLRGFILSVFGCSRLEPKKLSTKVCEAVGNPFVNTNLTCTAHSFFSSISPKTISNGCLNRNIVAFLTGRSGCLNENRSDFNPTQQLIDNYSFWRSENLGDLMTSKSKVAQKLIDIVNPSNGNETIFNPDEIVENNGDYVPSTLKTLVASESIRRKIIDHANEIKRIRIPKAKDNQDLILANLLERNHEHCCKAATLFALSEDQNATEVSLSHWDKAVQFVDISLNTILLGVSNVSCDESKKEEAIKRVISNLARQLKPTSDSAIWRSLRNNNGLFSERKDFDAVIKLLRSHNEILLIPKNGIYMNILVK